MKTYSGVSVCLRKKRYGTAGEAGAEVERVNVLARRHRLPAVNAFRCHLCEGFHIGGRKKWGQR